MDAVTRSEAVSALASVCDFTALIVRKLHESGLGPRELREVLEAHGESLSHGLVVKVLAEAADRRLREVRAIAMLADLSTQPPSP